MATVTKRIERALTTVAHMSTELSLIEMLVEDLYPEEEVDATLEDLDKVDTILTRLRALLQQEREENKDELTSGQLYELQN